MKQKNSKQVIRFDTSDSFIEVMNSAYPIDKVQLNFVQYDKKTFKQTSKLPIYLNIFDALNLCNDILTGNFMKTYLHAKKKNTFNGQSINDYTSYFTDMGGISEENVSSKFDTLKEQFPFIQKGKGISRQLKIQKGLKFDWVLRAEYGLGSSSETGLIVPDGKPLLSINIPFTNKDLKKLAIAIKVTYSAYLNQHYAKNFDQLFPGDKINIYSNNQQ